MPAKRWGILSLKHISSADKAQWVVYLVGTGALSSYNCFHTECCCSSSVACPMMDSCSVNDDVTEHVQWVDPDVDWVRLTVHQYQINPLSQAVSGWTRYPPTTEQCDGRATGKASVFLKPSPLTESSSTHSNSRKEGHAHTHTQPFNGLWSGTTCVGRYQKKHPLTPNLIIRHPLSSSSIYNDQWHPLCFFVQKRGPVD